MKRENGFTLVEIALVIVIIGLLMGGFLKGKEFITNAKIKNLETTFESVTKALYTYQERYQALPGDDTKANRFEEDETIKGITITVPAVKNGRIEGLFYSTIKDQESRLVWLHLRCARFINKPWVESMAQASDEWQKQPRHPFGGIIGVSNEPDGNNTKPGLFVGFTEIPSDIAFILDSKQDDGLDNSGYVRSQKDEQSENEAYKVYFYL